MTEGSSLNAAVPEGDTIRLAVFMAPTTHALARLISVIHSRDAKVLDLRWQLIPEADEGVAMLLLRVAKDRQRHLQTAIFRSIDVWHIVTLLFRHIYIR